LPAFEPGQPLAWPRRPRLHQTWFAPTPSDPRFSDRWWEAGEPQRREIDGMADAFVELQTQGQAADLAHAEWLALLLDREAANRNTRRFQIRLRSAKLRHGQAVIEDVDYRTPRRLDKALFQQLTAGKWVAEHRNLLVIGPCGVGKSWLLQIRLQ
jgi:DNA replication protein DnaC